MPKIVVCVPTVRSQCYKVFREAWDLHFKWWGCETVTIWDGDTPTLEHNGKNLGPAIDLVDEGDRDLFDYTRTDAVRNLAFYYAAKNLSPDYIYTLDDDCLPLDDTDPIGDHLKVLGKAVPGTWMNTLMGVDTEYVRGVPYQVRAENRVQISHGLWRNVMDWDGVTQTYLIPQSLAEPGQYQNKDYYIGPIPSGVYFPFSGMNVACTREALPLLFYTPQGNSIGYHRFGDIWCGLNLVPECAERNWSIYSGASVVNHSRASNVYTNVRVENLGLEINETLYKTPDSALPPFFAEYTRKRLKYQTRLQELLGLPA